MLACLVSLFVVALAAGARVGVAAEIAEVDARLDLLFGEHAAYRNFLRELHGVCEDKSCSSRAVKIIAFNP